MKFSSWLDALKAGSSRRPIRRIEPRGPRRKSAAGKLSVEHLEDRTVPALLAPVDYPVGAAPIAAVSGYFNNDTILDLAVANSSSNTVSVLLGNGDGTFQNAVTSSAGTSPSSLAVGDFNDDGDLDLATANSSGVSVLLGNGDGSFQTPSTLDVGSSPVSVAVGDFNDDGNLDLGVLSNIFVIDGYYYGYYGGSYPYGHNEGRANVLLGNGDGTFAASVASSLGSGFFTDAAVADFNGDGKDDFAATDNSVTVSVLLSSGGGNFLPSAAYTTGGSPQSVLVGDVNGDGIGDLVTGNGGSVSVLLGNGSAGVGDGTFQAANTTALDFSPTSLAVGDFNDDGKLDLAGSANVFVIDGYYYGSYGGSYPYGHFEGRAKVLLGYDNGHFTAPETTDFELLSVFGVASGDFDGDGFTDLAVTNSNNNVSVLINDPPWPPLPPPTVSINDAASVTEGNTGSTNATFTVTLAFAHDEDVTVHYSTANGSATAGSDYTAASGDVTILAGQTTATFTVAVRGDRVGESTETFIVTITSSDTLVSDGQGISTILDNEPQISIGDAADVTEGNTGSTNATFTVTLSEAYDQNVTVHYATANDSAAAGSDYTAASGNVTILAGQTTATFTVAVRGDRVGESIETFVVNLSGATNALIIDGSGTGTIIDNEPRVSINHVEKLEGNGSGKNNKTLLVFTVTLSESYDQNVTVRFATADGSAKVSKKDYTRTSGTVTFAPGQTTKTVTVVVKSDRNQESDEQFALILSGPSTNAFLLDNEGIGTILDDDTRVRRNRGR